MWSKIKKTLTWKTIMLLLQTERYISKHMKTIVAGFYSIVLTTYGWDLKGFPTFQRFVMKALSPSYSAFKSIALTVPEPRVLRMFSNK